VAVLFLHLSDMNLRIILFRGVFEILKVDTVNMYFVFDMTPCSLIGVADV
jgi:hypothetical protein